MVRETLSSVQSVQKKKPHIGQLAYIVKQTIYIQIWGTNVYRHKDEGEMGIYMGLILTLLWYHGVYVTPVLFDPHFFLNCHKY